MTGPSHRRDSFFKYYTADSAKLTLRNVTRKWSTATLFNDPFDNQFDLHFEDISGETVEKSTTHFLDIFKSKEPFKHGQFGALTAKMELIRRAYIENPDIEYTPDELKSLKQAQFEGMKRVTNSIEEANGEIRRIMADTTVFCLSETHDNLLMWSHYAENHQGAVVEFLPLKEVDSPLQLAQPVRYSTDMPRLNFASLTDLVKARKQVFDAITLTKSGVWSYEREWRVIASLRDKERRHELLPYAPEEVGAVFLGCKMGKEDCEEIIEITRSQFARAKIYQAEKHKTEFALLFSEIA